MFKVGKGCTMTAYVVVVCVTVGVVCAAAALCIGVGDFVRSRLGRK